jgi:methylated-DNA-[protein]-cysteine S-methyltransferase
MKTHQKLTVGSLSVRLEFHGNRLAEVRFPAKIPTGLTGETLRELEARLREFPLVPLATPFAQRVREAMQTVPFGKTATYGELAAQAGSPGAARAVGQVCARNPLVFIVPCHRVLSTSGLGGFRLGLTWKKRLLELETGG